MPQKARYRPPESVIGAFLWRKRLWFETTFGLSVMEESEKIIVGKYPLAIRGSPKRCLLRYPRHGTQPLQDVVLVLI